MRPELVAALHKYVREVAEEIQPLLPDHPSHPFGRKAVAHCYHVIKTLMGVPAKECRDQRYQDLVDIVTFCRDHASDMSICRQIRQLYPPEPQEDPAADLSAWLE